MIKPVFNFDLTSSFTLIPFAVNGAAGSQSVVGFTVPTGVNRLIFLASISHTEAAALHALYLTVGPTGVAAGVAMSNQVAQFAPGQPNAIIEPFVITGGWSLIGWSADAIAVGATLQLRGFYLDYLIR